MSRYHTPKVSRGLPKIKTHSFNSIKAAMPDMTTSERSNTGVAAIKGNLTAAYPKIHGWNNGPGGAIEQPLVTQTGFSGYL